MAKTKKVPSVDEELAEHLKQAEDHLIKAVELFLENKKLSRTTGFFTKLVRVQELVTALYREELIRIRGPLKRPRGR